jgi:hypothetical protein
MAGDSIFPAIAEKTGWLQPPWAIWQEEGWKARKPEGPQWTSWGGICPHFSIGLQFWNPKELNLELSRVGKEARILSH